LDEELKQHLQAMEQRLTTRIDEVKSQVKAYVDERCERLETTLLTEFHKWASPVEMRLRSHSSVLRTLDMDFEALSDRIKRIEGREPNQPH
jgi:chaperonin cofactor prefoldin